jgi:hypothetical protein
LTGSGVILTNVNNGGLRESQCRIGNKVMLFFSGNWLVVMVDLLLSLSYVIFKKILI